MKIVLTEQQYKLISEQSHSDYLRWKRKNVTIRGIKEAGQENNAGAMLGSGLYTAFLSNREMARKYGEVHFVVNAIPKNPKIFQYLNDAEIYLQNLVTIYCKSKNVPRSLNYFNDNTTVATEMLNNGYDGIVVKGREIVNYTPPDNVLYFKNEKQLINYFYHISS